MNGATEVAMLLFTIQRTSKEKLTCIGGGGGGVLDSSYANLFLFALTNNEPDTLPYHFWNIQWIVEIEARAFIKPTDRKLPVQTAESKQLTGYRTDGEHGVRFREWAEIFFS